MQQSLLELIDMIKDSLLLSTELKVDLIKRVDTLTEEEIAKLRDFLEAESDYVALDKEGILASINSILGV